MTVKSLTFCTGDNKKLSMPSLLIKAKVLYLHRCEIALNFTFNITKRSRFLNNYNNKCNYSFKCLFISHIFSTKHTKKLSRPKQVHSESVTKR